VLIVAGLHAMFAMPPDVVLLTQLENLLFARTEAREGMSEEEPN